MPRLVIALSAARATTDGWTLIGYTGDFSDTRYGAFSITPEQVASWQRNLAAGVVTGEPGMVGLDYEHAMDKPGQAASDMRASGWVTAIKLAGEQILAKIQWTAAAAQAIKDGEFRYFSPTFADSYNNDQGQDVGATLIGGALTNRPFLRSKGALCVQLSQGGHELVVPDDDMLKTLGYEKPESESENESSGDEEKPENEKKPEESDRYFAQNFSDMVRTISLDNQFRDTTGPTPMMGYKDCPVCGAPLRDSDSGACASCGHKLTAQTINVTITGDAAKLTTALNTAATRMDAPRNPAESASADMPNVPEFLKRLAQAMGLGDNATEDQIIAKVAQLAQATPDVRELAQQQGRVVLDAGQVATLTQQAQEGTAALEQVKTLTARLNLAEFETLMSQHPAAAPALRDTYKELWEQGQHEQVKRILSATPATVRMTPTGRAITVPAGDPGNGHLTLVQGQPLDRVGSLQINESRLELHQRVEALAMAKSVTYEVALDMLTATGEAV